MFDKSTSPPLTEYMLLFLLAFLWGGSFTLIKVALEGYPPATLVTVRIGFGGLLILLVALARGDVFPKTLMRWGELLVQGILQGALPFTLISWGEKYIDSSMAGVINSTPPMFVFLFTVFILRSAKIEAHKFLGVILGLAGVALVSGVRTESFVNVDSLAVLAVLGASASYATGAIYGRRFNDQSTFVTASCSLLCATLAMIPISWIADDPLSLRPELQPTLALIGLTIFSTAFASLIFFRLIKTLGSLATSSNAYLRALFSILLGVVFLAEPLTWAMAVATALIFLGVFMITGQYGQFVGKQFLAGRDRDV